MSLMITDIFIGACGLTYLLCFHRTTGASHDVHFSYSTQECVKVVNYIEGHKYTCENLPSRYYHVWVQ